MPGNIARPVLALVLLFSSVTLPAAVGQDGGDGEGAPDAGTGIIVNGDWPQTEDRSEVKRLQKVFGLLREEDGRFVGAGLSFSTGSCGDAGECITDLAPGGASAAPIRELRVDGGDVSVDSATATLANGGRALLAAAPPGVVTFRGGANFEMAISENASTGSRGPGVLTINEGDSRFMLVAPDGNVSATRGVVSLGLEQGESAFLVGSLEKGFGAIPPENATALLGAGSVGGFVAATRAGGEPVATATDLSGRVTDLRLGGNRLSATVNADGAGNLFVFTLGQNLLNEEGDSTAFAILVDGRIVPLVAAPNELWSGVTPEPNTAFASTDGTQVLVAVPTSGEHSIEFLQAGSTPLTREEREGLPSVTPEGRPAAALVGEFNETAPANALDGLYLTLTTRSDGGDLVLEDVSYPSKATPLWDSIRIEGAAGSLATEAHTATLDGGSADFRFYDSPPAWILMEATRDLSITLEPGDGVTTSLGGNWLVASLNEFHGHVLRWPASQEAAEAADLLTGTVDGATGAITLDLADGDRIAIVAHPDVGPNVAEFHNLLDLMRMGALEGVRESHYDIDLGEKSHWVGFNQDAFQILTYEGGVAQMRLQGAAEGRVAVVDLSPAFFEPHRPPTFEVAYDGNDVDFSRRGDIELDLNRLRSNLGALSATEESVRVAVFLPDASPHTVTLLQQPAPEVSDSGQGVIAFFLAFIVVGAIAAWYVKSRWEPS